MRRLAVLGTTSISFSAILVKLSGVSPAAAGFYRMAYAIPVLLLLALLLRKDGFRPARPLAWVAGMVFALNLFLWHRSIEYIGAGIATVLANVQVLFIALLGWLLLSERPSRTFFLVLPLLFAGVAFLTGLKDATYGSSPGLGVAFGALSGLTSASYVLIFRHASSQLEGGSLPTGLLLQTTAGAAITGMFLGMAFDPGFSFSAPLSAHAWLLLLALSAQVGGWLLLGEALRVLPALETAVIMLLQPVLALAWGWLVFGETTSPVQSVGVAIVLLSIVTLNISQARNRRTAQLALSTKETA